jgi:hypothetical protein
MDEQIDGRCGAHFAREGTGGSKVRLSARVDTEGEQAKDGTDAALGRELSAQSDRSTATRIQAQTENKLSRSELSELRVIDSRAVMMKANVRHCK